MIDGTTRAQALATLVVSPATRRRAEMASGNDERDGGRTATAGAGGEARKVSAVKATTASDRRPAAPSLAPRPPFPEATIAHAARGSDARRRGAAPGIAAHGLTKAFATPHGKVRAVRGVDLHLAPGETVALLGPNGAGKSTTIDLLLGLGRPDRGTVTIFGETPAAAVAAGRVAAMLQTGELIRDLSVREIVQMIAGLYPAPRDVDAVLETAGLTSIAGQRTQKLSGGERQRVRFAAALASASASSGRPSPRPTSKSCAGCPASRPRNATAPWSC